MTVLRHRTIAPRYGILGSLGDPTGKRVQVMGMSHYHWKNGKIVDEWTVYDELSLLT